MCVPVDLPNSYRVLNEAEVGHEWICRRLGEPEVILLPAVPFQVSTVTGFKNILSLLLSMMQVHV